MLVLTRKPGEQITIGNDITITVVEVAGNRIRLGIDAPGDVRILRAELAESWDAPAAVGSHEAELGWTAQRTSFQAGVDLPRCKG